MATYFAGLGAALGYGTVDTEARVAHALREYTALMEYKLLQEYHLTDVYVLPEFDNPFSWHGVLFVHEGLYGGGIFRFLIQIPENYQRKEFPNVRPLVFFMTSDVQHPMIDPETGELNTEIAFPSWTPGKDYIVLLLAHIKSIFYKKEYLHFGDS